jgi:hypothetical protein
MTAWKDLPNARRIDWVITSLKQHPDIWTSAPMAAWNAAWDAARDATWHVTRDAARDAALDAALRAAWDAASRGAAWAAARDAILALIGYDDCANLFDMPSEQLKTWVLLSEQSAAMLLLSAVIAREQISELNMA